MAPGRDAEFSEELIRGRYEGTLANDLGNLAHRIIHMIVQYCDGVVPDAGSLGDQEAELRDRCVQLVTRVFDNVESLSFDEGDVEEVVREMNRYVERNDHGLDSRTPRPSDESSPVRPKRFGWSRLLFISHASENATAMAEPRTRR